LNYLSISTDISKNHSGWALTEEQVEMIVNDDALDGAIDAMITHADRVDPDNAITEAHQYTQILPEKYYCPGSHALNRQVAFALKNTSNILFLSWIKLRSKADDFEFESIPGLFANWNNHFNVGGWEWWTDTRLDRILGETRCPNGV